MRGEVDDADDMQYPAHTRNSMSPSNLNQGRFVFPDDNPIPAIGSYVVTVTQHASDLNALTRLDIPTRALVTPYIRVVRYRHTAEDVRRSRVDRWAKEISRAMGRSSSYYIELADFDPLQVETDPGRGPHHGRPLLQALTEQLQRKDQHPVPVVPLGPLSLEQMSLFTTVAHGTGSGLAIRLTVGTGHSPATLVGQLRRLAVDLRVDPAQVDVLIESATEPESAFSPDRMAGVIDRVRTSEPWRNIILLSSDLPNRIAPPKEGSLLTLGRPAWSYYQDVASQLGGERPTFADYGIRHRSQLGAAGTKRANIRYTTDHDTVIALGRPSTTGWHPPRRYAQLCSAIARHELFDTSTNCETCRLIAKGSANADGLPPAQVEWDSYGLTHHLHHVVNQLGTPTSPVPRA